MFLQFIFLLLLLPHEGNHTLQICLNFNSSTFSEESLRCFLCNTTLTDACGLTRFNPRRVHNIFCKAKGEQCVKMSKWEFRFTNLNLLTHLWLPVNKKVVIRSCWRRDYAIDPYAPVTPHGLGKHLEYDDYVKTELPNVLYCGTDLCNSSRRLQYPFVSFLGLLLSFLCNMSYYCFVTFNFPHFSWFHFSIFHHSYFSNTSNIFSSFLIFFHHF